MPLPYFLFSGKRKYAKKRRVMPRRCCGTRGGRGSPSGLPPGTSGVRQTVIRLSLHPKAFLATPNGVSRHTKRRFSLHPKAFLATPSIVSRHTKKPPTYKSYKSYRSYLIGGSRVISSARQAYCQQPPSANSPHQSSSLAAPKGGVRFCLLLSVIVRFLW